MKKEKKALVNMRFALTVTIQRARWVHSVYVGFEYIKVLYCRDS